MIATGAMIFVGIFIFSLGVSVGMVVADILKK